MYDFRVYNTIRTFGTDIYEEKISLKEADQDQSLLINEISEFNEKTKPKKRDKKNEKKVVIKNLDNFYTAR